MGGYTVIIAQKSVDRRLISETCTFGQSENVLWAESMCTRDVNAERGLAKNFSPYTNSSR